MSFCNTASFKLTLLAALAVTSLGGCATQSPQAPGTSAPVAEATAPAVVATSAQEPQPAVQQESPQVSQAVQDHVKARAEARWQSLVKRDFESTYAYLAPSVRESTSLEQYRGRFGAAVAWSGASVVAVDCKSERCTLTIAISAKALVSGASKGGMPLTTHLDETWVQEKGEWWFLPSPDRTPRVPATMLDKK